MNLSIEQIFFLKLLNTTLFGADLDVPDNMRWDIVYEIAKIQCVIALLESVVPSDCGDKWRIASYNNIANCIKALYEQDRIVELFHNNGIPMVVIKGMAAAMYYPDPKRRTVGDIDILVYEANYTDAQKIIESIGGRLTEETERHKSYIVNGIIIEIHKKFSSHYYNNIDMILMDGMKQAKEYHVHDSVFWGLPTYENGLVILGHIMQHFKAAGIGFRQIIDWMMFVHNELDDSAWENYFRSLAREAGLEKLAITITYLCKKWLGLPDNISWCDEADDILVDSILERLFIDGNFGVDRTVAERIRNNKKNIIRKEGFFRYLQKEGIRNWQFAKKYHIFQPIAWIYQMGLYFRKAISEMVHGKKMARKVKPRMELDEIWKRIE